MKQPLIPSRHPSSHPPVIIIINLNPNGRRQLGIGIRFSLLFYNGGGRGGGVRPMGRVGFRNKGSMGRGEGGRGSKAHGSGGFQK
jgi:hypothetical protein